MIGPANTERNATMKVLVTGIDGYIGAILGPYLAQKGYDVTGFDTGFYRQGWLYPMRGPRPQVITKDLREVTARDLEGFEFNGKLGQRLLIKRLATIDTK